MKSHDVRKKYIEFFKARGHVEIPSAPLVPQNDPTTLFNSSGMQPLVPYLLGEPHPAGKRLVNSQKAIRTQDIEEVGDNRHTTFFEMLGNWSLGDYFKKEQLAWIFEFITKELGLDPKRLYVTVFEGNDSVPKDTVSIDIWKELFKGVGIEANVGKRIFTYPAKKNWWSRSGEPEKMPPGEPGGPDSEVFFDFGEHLKLHEQSQWKDEACHPNCDCGRFLEIANSVFMQYQKQDDGSLKELSQKNVDFGGGLERMVAATNDDPDVFKIDLLWPIIERIVEISGRDYLSNAKSMRIIADHIRASCFLVAEGVTPYKEERGSVLRRLIRKAVDYTWELGIEHSIISYFAEAVIKNYQDVYPEMSKFAQKINNELSWEEERYIRDTISEESLRKLLVTRGLYTSGDIDLKTKRRIIDGKILFNLKQTYGISLPTIQRYFRTTNQDVKIDLEGYDKALREHQAISRVGAEKKFKGGLADHSEATTKLHTAHHLLLAALQKLVDPSIKQRGSNITAERLRMDFSFSRKVTPDELAKVEALVNEKIKEDLPVTRREMAREEAETVGAQMEFGHKYPDRVNVYFVGDPDAYFSAEFCGGPHVEHTGVIGKFKILKEESAAAGIRRIYGVVE